MSGISLILFSYSSCSSFCSASDGSGQRGENVSFEEEGAASPCDLADKVVF